MIEFRDVQNLEQMVYILVAHPHHPCTMCTTSQSTLLFEASGEIKSVDCSPTPPTISSFLSLPQDYAIRDLCYVMEGDCTYVAVVNFTGGLMVYNVDGGKLEWEAPKKLPDMTTDMEAWAVTTDGFGRLFVVDHLNRCVQMFSINCTYIGALKSVEFQKVLNIQWCTKSASLLLHYELSDKQYLGTAKVVAV